GRRSGAALVASGRDQLDVQAGGHEPAPRSRRGASEPLIESAPSASRPRRSLHMRLHSPAQRPQSSLMVATSMAKRVCSDGAPARSLAFELHSPDLPLPPDVAEYVRDKLSA